MYLKENKIYLHGFTDSFTYNNVDYSLANYDKDMYELYFKEVQNENVRLMCDLLEFKEDIEHCTKIRQLTKASYHEMKNRYSEYLNRFELYKTHFVINLYTQKDVEITSYKILSTLKVLHMHIEDYGKFTINKEPFPYSKFLKIEEVPGRFTNAIKKLKESVFKDSLNKIDINKLGRY